MVGEQGEQQLLADRLRRGTPADALEPLERGAVEGGREQVVRDQTRLEQTLELCVSAAELVQRFDKDRVRLVTTEEEELAAEQQRNSGPLDRSRAQLVCFLQVLDCRVAVDLRLRRAELEQQLGTFVRARRLGERAP